jgi:hypothetical protein
VPSAPAQAQGRTQTLSQSSTPIQDEIDQQNIDEITCSTSMGSASHHPQPSTTGDDGWTDDLFDELDKELGLALMEQGKSLSAGAPTSSPRSAEALQDEIQSRECTETTGSRPAELQDNSRYGTAHEPEREQRQTEGVVEGGGVAMRQREEPAAQEDELGQPAVGGQQDPVEVVDVDDTEPQGN